jgi:hypothetical protein
MHRIQCKLSAMLKFNFLTQNTVKWSRRALAACAILLMSHAVSAQGMPRDSSFSAWKVNAIELQGRQWNVSCESAWKESLTTQWSFGLLAQDVAMSTEALAFYFDEWGNWGSIPSQMATEHRSVYWSLDVRDYKREAAGGAIYTAATFRHRYTAVELRETFELPVEAILPLYGVFSDDPLNHTMRMHEIGLGVELGAQWTLKNGLLLEAFVNPFVRILARSLESTSLEGSEVDELNDAMQKLHWRYSSPVVLENAYAAKTGPWLRFGLALGFRFNQNN